MVWSPNGAMLVARYDANGDYDDDLCLMRPDGTGTRMIKAGSATRKIAPRSWRNF
ncbi:MAG: hypothetical protein V9G19_06960 [Tetrasphaera sp.]